MGARVRRLLAKRPVPVEKPPLPPPPRPSPVRPWVAGVLALLMAAGLALRLRGLDWQMPHRVEIDGQLVYQAAMLDGDRLQVEKFRGTYGLLIPYLAKVLPRAEQAPYDPATTTLEEHRRRASADVLRIRLVGALLSLLIVPATFLLARRIVSDGAALLAAGLAAFDLMHVSLAQQARPHAAAAALGAVAMLACLELRRRPSVRASLLAGVAVGWTLGTLQSGIALLLPLGAAYLLRRGGSRWLVAPGLAAAAVLAVVCYPTTGLQVDPQTSKIVQSAHFISFEEWHGRGFAKLARALWGYAPLGSVLALAGLALWIPRGRARPAAGPLERRDLLVVLAFVAPYLLAIGVFDRFQDRFALPLLPYLACLGALAAERVHARLAAPLGRTGRAALAVGGAAALLAFPAYVSARLVGLRAGQDTLSRATDWIRAHVAEDETVLVLAGLDPPLFHGDRALLENGAFATEIHIMPRYTHWFRYQREVQRRAGAARLPLQRWDLRWVQPEEVLDEAGRLWSEGPGARARYVVLERYPPARDYPLGTAAVDALIARGELVERFSCYADGRTDLMPLECEGLPGHWTLNMTRAVLACSAVGPVVEIYRLPRGPG